MADCLTFATKLKMYRRMKGWSSAKASQKCGMSEDQYRHVEDGQNQPLAGTWNKILCGFDLDPTAFPHDDFEKAGQ